MMTAYVANASHDGIHFAVLAGAFSPSVPSVAGEPLDLSNPKRDINLDFWDASGGTLTNERLPNRLPPLAAWAGTRLYVYNANPLMDRYDIYAHITAYAPC